MADNFFIRSENTMEDFLKFLLIAGIVLVGIFREVNKSKAKKAKDKRPAPSIPPTAEIAPDAVPMPQTWDNMFPPQDLYQPIPIEKPTPKPALPKKKQAEQRQANVSQYGTLGKSKVGTTGLNAPHSAASPQEGAPPPANDYSIHSAEEARRAIIWGEILQRKY